MSVGGWYTDEGSASVVRGQGEIVEARIEARPGWSNSRPTRGRRTRRGSGASRRCVQPEGNKSNPATPMVRTTSLGLSPQRPSHTMSSASTALARALPKTLKELRLHLCQTGQASAGTREFIQSSYQSIKSSNPSLPFLVREAQGTPARVFARFERGVEKHAELDGLNAAQVQKKVQELLS
ncbi:unnamed protein product [Parajaminaea phylloscopi]